jgi:hypothetical protein
MRDPVPDYLESTWQMLSAAYPTGATDEEYYALIEILLRRLSFHNVSTVLRAFLPDRNGHYNDVSGVAGGAIAVNAVTREGVEQRLAAHGLAEWLAAPE